MPNRTKICSLDGCVKLAHSGGLCSGHARRVRLYGDPHKTKNRKPGEGFFALGYLTKQVDGTKKAEHIRIAEKALGRPLPPGAVVHHANCDKSDNRNENLVICPSRAYHNLLHRRIDAMNACGNPNWRKCRHCKQYDDPKNLRLYETANTTQSWHLQCARDAAKTKYWSKHVRH